MIVVTRSAEESFALGEKFGQTLIESNVVCFFGDLGAGKTTFIKGLVKGAIQYPPSQVNSPTFVLLNIYEGTFPLYHFDLYRLKEAEEFILMGFDEYLGKKGIVCIEWAERIVDLLPTDSYQIHISTLSPTERQIQIIKQVH